MRNIKLTIQYDGSNYHGWQIQPNGISIQQVIEEAIFSITKKEPKLTTSGRTDAGVHALSQVANFKTTSMLDTDKLQKGLNSILPKDIVILDAQEVPLDARIFIISSGTSFSLPTSIKVPTIFLTIFFRNPFPSTSMVIQQGVKDSLFMLFFVLLENF